MVSVSEKITKTWTANQVTEGNSVVYAKTGSGNIKAGYSKFKLDLSSKASATLTEFDGNSFIGTWEVVGDKTLILKSLNPQPTDTNGLIEYSNLIKISSLHFLQKIYLEHTHCVSVRELI